MDITEHWIQQVIGQGHVRVQHIESKFNVADMMVKALTKSKFSYWMPSLMGLFQELEVKTTPGEVLDKHKWVTFESV